MHNEVGNFEINNSNKFVFDAEKFGLGNPSENIEKEIADGIRKDISADVVEKPAKVEPFGQRGEISDRDRYIESARLAMDTDGSSRTKTIGKEFSKLVQEVISKDSDDPAKLNDEYDSLSRQAIRGMFGREIGGGK